MNEKATRFSQVVAASASVTQDAERFLNTESTEDLERLKKSIADFRRILEAYKQNPIHD